MTKEREALKLALDALEQLQGGCTDSNDGTYEAITVWCPEVIDAIQEALAQPEQNQFNPDWDAMAVMVEEQQRMAKRIAELEAQRKPLTVDEVWQNDQLMALNAELGCGLDLLMEVVEAIEAAHGIKE